MSASAVLICVVLALAISIYLNNKFDYSVGLWALVFAYLIGCWGLGFKPSALVKYWPTTFSFVIVSLSLFYGYAGKTGVMDVLSKKIIYANRKRTWIIPVIIFLIGFLLTVTGCSTYTVTGLLAPIGYEICITAGLNTIVVVASVMIPAAVGSFAPWCSGAARTLDYFAGTQWGEMNSEIQWCVWGNSLIIAVIAYACVFIVCKGWKSKTAFDMEKPGDFNQEHKTVLTIIACVSIIVILPAVLKLCGIKAKWFDYLDIQFVALVGAAAMRLCKVGGEKAEKEIIAKGIPWSMLFLAVGVTVLMNVGKDGGAVDLLANFIVDKLPPALIPAGIAVLAGFMSFFCGGMTVCVPTLLPLVEPLFMSGGISPIATAGAILIGANLTACSPVSTGGAIMLGFCPDEAWRKKQFNQQFVLAISFLVLEFIFGALGGFKIFQLAIFR